MGGWVEAVVQAVIDFLIDENCHGCGRGVAAAEHLALPDHPAACALAAPVRIFGVPGVSSVRTHLLCRACVREVHAWDHPVTLVPPALAGAPGLRVFPAFRTGPALLDVIHTLKFGRREPVAGWLADAMALGLPARALGASGMLVPVPMDRAAQRRRGFNQAVSIARRLQRNTGLPLVRDAIVKRFPTTPQSLLGREDRLRNLAGAFAPGPGAERVRGAHALLVDDLVTSGATVRACAAALAHAGVASVAVVCAGYRP